MASGQGTVTFDFGAHPGSNEASATFTDATIGGTSKIEAYFMANDTTTDHTAADHRYAGLFISLTAAPSAGVGGTVYARSTEKMQGTFTARYVWAD